MSQVRISRQQWQGLLSELDLARRQRHLLTYRALLERLQLPSPAMQTLTAALEYLAVLDARAEQPLRSSLVISQGASRLPRTGFFRVCRASGAVFRAGGRYGGGILACLGSGAGVRVPLPGRGLNGAEGLPGAVAFAGGCQGLLQYRRIDQAQARPAVFLGLSFRL